MLPGAGVRENKERCSGNSHALWIRKSGRLNINATPLRQKRIIRNGWRAERKAWSPPERESSVFGRSRSRYSDIPFAPRARCVDRVIRRPYLFPGVRPHPPTLLAGKLLVGRKDRSVRTEERCSAMGTVALFRVGLRYETLVSAMWAGCHSNHPRGCSNTQYRASIFPTSTSS